MPGNSIRNAALPGSAMAVKAYGMHADTQRQIFDACGPGVGDRGFGDRVVPDNYLGSCLCARVGYRLLSPPRAVTHCHCGQCRKSHGAAFASYGAVPRKDLCIVSGQSDIKSYASSASVHRQFCQHCGSSLFWSRQAGDWADWICIALGTLDSPFSALKQKHAHLESQPLWSSFAGGCMRND